MTPSRASSTSILSDAAISTIPPTSFMNSIHSTAFSVWCASVSMTHTAQ